MKQFTIFLFIIAASFSLQAQSALTKFADLCTACNENSAESAARGCRVMTGLCDIISDDSDMAIQKENDQLKQVLFAFESNETIYGTSALLEIVNKKGEVIYKSEVANMIFMNSEGKVYKSISTSAADAMARNIQPNETVLFSMPTAEIEYSKRNKLKVKVSVLKMNTTNREMEVAASFQQRLL